MCHTEIQYHQDYISASQQAAANRAQQTGENQNEAREASRTNARLGISLQVCCLFKFILLDFYLHSNLVSEFEFTSINFCF